jgi:hypothetical protein
MRILLLALMIALLPVRGWMGNAMALDMASQAVAQAQKTGAGVSAQADAAMPPDCPMHAQQADPDAYSADAAAAGTVHCNGCDTCELCLALATATWPDGVRPTITRHAAPLAAGYRFSSADRFSTQKPPIS